MYNVSPQCFTRKLRAAPGWPLSKQQYVHVAWREVQHLCSRYPYRTALARSTEQCLPATAPKFSFPCFLCQVIPQRAETAANWLVYCQWHPGRRSLEALTSRLFCHQSAFFLCIGKTSESKLVYGKGNNGEIFWGSDNHSFIQYYTLLQKTPQNKLTYMHFYISRIFSGSKKS